MSFLIGYMISCLIVFIFVSYVSAKTNRYAIDRITPLFRVTIISLFWPLVLIHLIIDVFTEKV
jgi:hypothetical protein